MSESVGHMVRLIGILLIAQGIIRLESVASTLMFPSALMSGDPYLLTVSVLTRAALGSATLVAGILLAMQASVGRGVGIAVCALCLIYDALAFSVGANARFTPGWTFWLLYSADSVLFATGLVVLRRGRPLAAR
jgi:hypothetical protein